MTEIRQFTSKGSRTRERIVEAAGELLLTRGFAATSLDDVEAAAGTGSSQLYHYFDSKSDLLQAVAVHEQSLARPPRCRFVAQGAPAERLLLGLTARSEGGARRGRGVSVRRVIVVPEALDHVVRGCVGLRRWFLVWCICTTPVRSTCATVGFCSRISCVESGCWTSGR